MFQNHHRYIDFLVEHQLTNEQFMFLYILYADSLETDGDGDRVFPREGPAIASIWKYAQAMKSWPRASLQDLVDRGFARFRGPADKFIPDLMEVTEQFRKLLFVGPEEAALFWDAYPVPQRTGITFHSIIPLYRRTVLTLLVHRQVMDALQWGIRHHLIDQNIRVWITNQRWKDVECIRRCRDLHAETSQDITFGTSEK